VLLAEALALLAVDPGSGRHAIGRRGELNACLAGLLLAELVLEGVVQRGARDDQVVVTGGPPTSATLVGATTVVADSGPKVKAILSHMDRGLAHHLGLGTWDAVVAGLVGTGVLSAASGGARPRHALLAPDERHAIVARLRAAADGGDDLDLRTAAVLSMTGPANLLEVVAPTRATRRHARNRIDHALDGTDLEATGKIVRRLIADAAAAAVVTPG